ncbi:MAG: hypothetical protein ACREQY_04095, partial [Candidatus Binatia bacterium]
MLFQLEPRSAVPLFLVASIGFAGILLREKPAAESPPVTLEAIALLSLIAWWCGNLWLRSSGPRASVDTLGLVAGTLLFLVLTRRPLGETSVERFVVGIATGALVTALYGQYQYWIMFPAIAPLMHEIYGQGPFLSVNANFYSANCYAPFLAATLVLIAGLAIGKRHVSPWLAIPPLL